MIITPRVPSVAIAKAGMLVSVDPAYPNAWRREPYYGQLLPWAKRYPVEIRVGLRYIALYADGTEKEVTVTEAWIEGRSEGPEGGRGQSTGAG
jgi:hypothetical protein